MNFCVKIFKGFAAMTDHRRGKSGQRFGRNFDRARNEKFIVRLHLLSENALYSRPIVPPEMAAELTFFLDETDVAAAFYTRDF